MSKIVVVSCMHHKGLRLQPGDLHSTCEPAATTDFSTYLSVCQRVSLRVHSLACSHNGSLAPPFACKYAFLLPQMVARPKAALSMTDGFSNN